MDILTTTKKMKNATYIRHNLMN